MEMCFDRFFPIHSDKRIFREIPDTDLQSIWEFPWISGFSMEKNSVDWQI
jgi:hypothetical protein